MMQYSTFQSQKRLYTTEYLENTKKFIKESTENKPFFCLTTDLFPMYRNVADELNVKHQIMHISFI